MTSRATASRIVAGAVYVSALTLLAAVAAWPIYRTPAFVLLVVVAAAVGAGIATAALLLRWPGWLTAASIGGAVLLLGVPLAVPARLSSPSEWGVGLMEVVRGSVTAWKDLLTIPLPAGDYRNLMVPPLLVFLIGVPAMLLLAWRRPPLSALAVLVGVGMVSFGLLFGRTTVSAPMALDAFVLPAPVETAIGVAGLVASLLWLAWQSHDERVRSLRRAATATGVRVTRAGSGSDSRRSALGAVMIVIAVGIGAAVTPAVAQGHDRAVLRSGIGPDIALSQAVSPLTQYRSNFDDERVTTELFRVEVTEGSPERVRIATLAHYDGEAYRVVDPDGGAPEARFVRMPSPLEGGSGEAVVAGVVVAGLETIWLPTIGSTVDVDFVGERAPELADAFYYSRDLRSGVEVAGGGVESGDAYILTAVEPVRSPLAAAVPPSGGSTGGRIPESLRQWMGAHVEGAGGAALQGLVDLLRSRGYLSHAVSIQGEDGNPAWMAELPGYAFQPSAAGHSLARIDAMFRALLQREGHEEAAGQSLVAAVGDDEQFSVAIALMAEELGFPARVVVGARLVDGGEDLPYCVDGICRGADIAAWTEVLAAGGDWIPIDATPQRREQPVTDLSRQRDPENPTEVRPESAEQVVPPDPLQQESGDSNADEDAAGPDLSTLWRALRVASIAMLTIGLVALPLLVVFVAKILRRRARRARADAARAIVGGWEEFVDAAVDHGRPVPRAETRAELAGVFGTPQAAMLAERADRAVFAGDRVTEAETIEFWRIVEDERHALAQGENVWRRLLAAVSLRSFTRAALPRTADARVSAPRQERRRRRPRGDTRSS